MADDSTIYDVCDCAARGQFAVTIVKLLHESIYEIT